MAAPRARAVPAVARWRNRRVLTAVPASSVSPSITADLPLLSVVVPLAPDEPEWSGLAKQLAALPLPGEVIVVHPASSTNGRPPNWPAALDYHELTSPAGRARQMNAGANAARGHWLWLLHADSRLTPTTWPKLGAFLTADQRALGYFDLAFRTDGPRLTGLNAWSANLRSRWLGLPFGDQGFVLPREVFDTLGGFDETLPRGEDHRLVWAARGAGIPLVRIAAPLLTSGRKYATRGWLATTLAHGALTLAQAWSGWRHGRTTER